MECAASWCWDGTVSFGDIISGAIALLGVVAAVGTFAYQLRKSDEQAADQAEKAVKLQKIEIYQRLETASATVFAYEGEHRAQLEQFRDVAPKIDETKQKILENYLLLEAGADPEIVIDKGASEVYAKLEEDLRAVRKYYEMTMNLFEVAARFRRDGIFEPEVFGSWTIWFYETSKEWGFRWWWPDLRANYMNPVRRIFDIAVYTFQFEPEEDIRSALASADREEKLRIIKSEAKRLDEIEASFFQHVAAIYGCGVVEMWRRNLDEDCESVIAAARSRTALAHRTDLYHDWSVTPCDPLPLTGVAKSLIPSPFLDEDEREERRLVYPARTATVPPTEHALDGEP